MHSTEHTEQIVLECLKNSEDGIVVLPTGMPWKALLIPEGVYYVVYPSPRGGYNAYVTVIEHHTRMGINNKGTTMEGV